jgi:hypothetical protein
MTTEDAQYEASDESSENELLERSLSMAATTLILLSN